ncbi:MAG: hypothetical protein JO007_14680 [Alphaproteobacteria bacterium]|nr:hypothetical protein [Alphaproteobacteria bacterium]
MRLILTLALAAGLASLCQVQVGAAAVGQPQRGTKTDCGTAAPGVSSGNPTGQSTNATCPPERLDWRLSQHGPGFWTPEAMAPALGDVAGGSRPTVLRAPPSQASADAPGCISYRLMVVISGEPREATVVGCPQPDGGWQVTQYTPGLPIQVFNVPAPPTTAPLPDDFGGWNSAPVWDWAAQPWFFGFAPAVVVGSGFNRFHRFRHEFAHGFGHGFAHGIAAGRGFTGVHNFAVGPRPGFATGAGFVARRR